jgi:hypothetical protein
LKEISNVVSGKPDHAQVTSAMNVIVIESAEPSTTLQDTERVERANGMIDGPR